MKLAAPLLLVLLGLSISGCNTLANRRDLYSPKKGDGYWTRTLDDGTWKKRGPKAPEEPKQAKKMKKRRR